MRLFERLSGVNIQLHYGIRSSLRNMAAGSMASHPIHRMEEDGTPSARNPCRCQRLYVYTGSPYKGRRGQWCV